MRNRISAERSRPVLAWLGVLLACLLPVRAHGTEWSTFDGPAFSLDHPAGWQVKSDDSQGTIDVQGLDGEKVTFWPVYVRQELTPPLAVLVLEMLVSRIAPTATWTPAANIAGPAVKLVGSDDDGRSLVASLSWVATKQGSAATFVCVSVPMAAFDQAAEQFSEILGSLRLSGHVEESPTAEIEFELWHDPQEGAFEVEIPKDWQVHGGLARLAAADTRPAVEIRSPAGRLRVYLGDAHTPTFIAPSPSLEGAGFVEGSWYAPPLGLRMQVRRFMSGAQFARWFATTTVARDMTALRFGVVRNRPDVDRSLARILRRAGLAEADQQINAGEGEYTCRDEEALFVGYAFAATLEKPLSRGNGTQWNIRQNFGYLAPAEEAALADAVLRRLVTSFRFNPDWVAKQKHLPANFAEISARTATRIAQMLGETHNDHAVTRARAERLRTTQNIVADVTDATDPATGMPLQLESGAGYYWLDPRGNVIGTEIYSVPNVNAGELVRRR